MSHELNTGAMSESPEAPAAACPGCSLPILFDPVEFECDDQALRDVMCAWCGTVTSRWLLIAQAYDSRRASAVRPRG
jgi:hypothetical protein